ncbi:type IV toxin-antitoxin system AbiEi family antitoxin domain-containing protein [Knoellia sp. CPCC 206435]|uniref:type IV toxin-antitoxin system AbiEi family antitoxin domain-containing protein n=1 Tax=Knoellia terrae TaxID=3404797 RepID=UPI003B427E39
MDVFSSLPQPFSRAEAITAGHTASAVSRAARRGSLTKVSRGLYAVSAPWCQRPVWERHRDLSRAAARLTPDAILSHSSAAAVMGLPHPAYAPDLVSMTVLDDVRTSPTDDWRRFHRGATPYAHIEICDGHARLNPPRTVIDCARELHGRDALAVADGALRAGVVSHAQLLAVRRHQRRWPGVAASNDVLLLADGRRENWLESVSAWAMARWGCPPATPQVEILTPDGEFIARVDNLWPEQGIVGEADGVQKYLLGGATDDAVRAALAEEEHRQARLLQHGLRVLRWTPREAISGAEIHGRLQALLLASPLHTVSAVYRCACCRSPLVECAVDEELRRWRARLATEFERRFW